MEPNRLLGKQKWVIFVSNVGDRTTIMNNLLQHLKELNDPAMENVLLETENMLARGRMDLPLSLCFAALRGDDLLLHQLLKRGLDPNEADSNGRTALHIAAANGHENCALLLLDFGAEPNCRDSDGNVPLWDAIINNHEHVMKLLIDNGATLSGESGGYACFAAEKNDLHLLEELVRHGGDVTQPKPNGTTALHVAVCEGNLGIVKFLLSHGADIDRADVHGWTPRDLADQQGHEEIKTLFQSQKEIRAQSAISMPDLYHGVRCLGKFKSEPVIVPAPQDSLSSDGSWGKSQPRRRTNKFHNSLFGIMSTATGDRDIFSPAKEANAENCRNYQIPRVTMCCPEKGDIAGKLVLLPLSYQELLEIGAKRYGFLPTKVRTRDGAEIDDIDVIRDGDHLILSTDGAMEDPMTQNEDRTS